MVRKVRNCLLILLLCCAFGTTAQAVSYTTYDGNISSSYTTYFRDIVSGIKISDNYVYFRSGQYEYVMVVGDLAYDNGIFTLDGDTCTVYKMSSDNNYNGYYTYEVFTDTSFSLSSGDKVVYSDLGQFPQLVERGSKYEIVSALFIGIALLSVVIKRIFC